MNTAPVCKSRIAAPRVGGIATFNVLTLLVIPAIYALGKEVGLRKPQHFDRKRTAVEASLEMTGKITNGEHNEKTD